MVLDALVIKNRGSDGLADVLADDGGEDEGEEEMAKMGVEELWKMLSEGVEKVFDPEVEAAEDLTATGYDRLISSAEPAKWDDKTGGDDESSAKASADMSKLNGTIFAKKKVGRPKKPEVIDLLSSDDESSASSESSAPSVVDTSFSDSSVSDVDKEKRKAFFEPVVGNSSEVVGGRRIGKRTRVAPTKFEASYFEKDPGKKRKKIAHDSSCFCCRRGVIKPEKFDGKNGKCEAPVVPKANAGLECIACPRVYHLSCSGETARPKTRSWYCPWHACVTCQRKKTDAGGTLFHCMTCPLTFCFDCAPDEYTEGGQSTSTAALALTQKLERKNMPSVKNMMFFSCRDCKARADMLHPAHRKNLDGQSNLGFIYLKG